MGVSCAIAFGAFAQTQQGYVKTLGKPLKKGEALSGVTVRVKGEHNAVVSQKDGKFSLPMHGKKSGEPYSLQQVHKNGYELNDQSIIGRKFAFSTTVPLTVVMVSTEDLQADKLRIENNAYRAAERNYQAKVAELEKKLKKNIISAEQYQTEIQDLVDKFEKYQSLIESMAEHYAHTDYDNLNDKEAEVNILIEEGELEKADSLIHTMFDPMDVLKRNKESLARLDQTIFEAQDVINQANADMAAVLKQQKKDAEYLYQLYTIALAQFDNDKAAHYIQIRAELDTTNVQWQNEAGLFIEKYLADYPLALKYLHRVLEYAQTHPADDTDELIATEYNNIGSVHNRKGEFDKALEYHLKALEIYEKSLGTEHAKTATSLNNIGSVYSNMGDDSTALVYHFKAQKIYEQVCGPEDPHIASSYINIGSVYSRMGDYLTALGYNLKALDIYEKVYGTMHPETATTYSNIGSLYYTHGNYTKALEYQSKALNVWEKVLGKGHPDIAHVYNNVGNIYVKLQDILQSPVPTMTSVSPLTVRAATPRPRSITRKRSTFGRKHPTNRRPR